MQTFIEAWMEQRQPISRPRLSCEQDPIWYGRQGGGEVMRRHSEDRVQTMYILRGVFGIAAMLLMAWLLSSNRRRINWRLVLRESGLRSLIAGTIACFMTACIAGMLV